MTPSERKIRREVLHHAAAAALRERLLTFDEEEILALMDMHDEDPDCFNCSREYFETQIRKVRIVRETRIAAGAATAEPTQPFHPNPSVDKAIRDGLARPDVEKVIVYGQPIGGEPVKLAEFAAEPTSVAPEGK